jgi:hypothetical protein
MQKLNAREYFVVVLVSIITIVFLVLVFNELFSNTSPFVTTSSGEISTHSTYIINVLQNLVKVILGIVAAVFLLKKRRIGWIAAFSVLLFFAFIAWYLVGMSMMAGIIDTNVYIGLGMATLLLLALIFLCFPSTIKKFQISCRTIIPIAILLALLATTHFLVPNY